VRPLGRLVRCHLPGRQPDDELLQPLRLQVQSVELELPLSVQAFLAQMGPKVIAWAKGRKVLRLRAGSPPASSHTTDQHLPN